MTGVFAMGVRNLQNRKEDLTITLAIRQHAKDAPDKPTVVESARCKVYLPEKVTDSISLVFHLNIEQYRVLEAARLWRFSIEGKEGDPGEHRTRISADNVYQVNLTVKHWSPEVVEAILIAEPLDLKQELFAPSDNSTDSLKTHGRYWLTPNRLLSPAQSVSTSYTGEVKVKTDWKLDVLLEDVPLTFGKRY